MVFLDRLETVLALLRVETSWPGDFERDFEVRVGREPGERTLLRPFPGDLADLTVDLAMGDLVGVFISDFVVDLSDWGGGVALRLDEEAGLTWLPVMAERTVGAEVSLEGACCCANVGPIWWLTIGGGCCAWPVCGGGRVNGAVLCLRRADLWRLTGVSSASPKQK